MPMPKTRIALVLVTSLFLITVTICGIYLPVAEAGGGATPTATAATQNISTQGQDASYYIVKPGDTLYGIAQRYGVSAADLQNWNGISDPRTLKPGQRLKIFPGQDAPMSAQVTTASTSLPVPIPTICAFAVGMLLLVGVLSLFDRRKK